MINHIMQVGINCSATSDIQPISSQIQNYLFQWDLYVPHDAVELCKSYVSSICTYTREYYLVVDDIPFSVFDVDSNKHITSWGLHTYREQIC